MINILRVVYFTLCFANIYLHADNRTHDHTDKISDTDGQTDGRIDIVIKTKFMQISLFFYLLMCKFHFNSLLCFSYIILRTLTETSELLRCIR